MNATVWMLGLPVIPPAATCQVLTDPASDTKCGNLTAGLTALDVPICNACFEETRIP